MKSQKVLAIGFFHFFCAAVFSMGFDEWLKSCGSKFGMLTDEKSPSTVNASEAALPWVRDSRQLRLSSLPFPKPVLDSLSSITRASERSKKSSEFGALLLEVGGKVRTATNEEGGQLITSNDPRRIAGAEWDKAATNLMQEMQYGPAVPKDAPVTIYQMHTHPDREVPDGAMTRPPIYSTDGKIPFTHTNEDDIASANQMGTRISGQLRAAGYTGPIRVVALVTPAKVGPGERYVVLYSREF